MATENEPLRFNVIGKDGEVLDSFTEEDLATYGTGKTWHEAVCWAKVAWDNERQFPPTSTQEEA